MNIRKVIPKARKKAKTNNFKSILEQFLEKYGLSAKSTSEQLSEHNKEFDALLQDWKACKCVKNLLTWHKFSKKKIGALILDKKKEKFTIEKRVEYCAKIGNKWDIHHHSINLGPKNNDKKEVIADALR